MAGVKWFWRFFSSIRLALVLILIITGVSLIGALTSLNIINSVFFFIPGVMLMINILICSLNRWKGIRRSIRGSEIHHSDDFYLAGKTNLVVKTNRLSFLEASEEAAKVFAGHGYRVRKAQEENSVHIATDKNRYYRLGTYFSHFSLILFVAAFLAGSAFGFRDTDFRVAEGQTVQVGHDTNLSLKLISFTDEYYPDGTPKDYRSDVILYENGQEVKQALIRVNHPLTYKGVRFYQSFFGTNYRAGLTVRDSQGNVIFEEPVTLDIPIDEYSNYLEGYFDLPDQGLIIRLIISTTEGDTMIPADSIAVGIIQNNEQINLKLIKAGTPTVVNGLEFTYNGIQDGGKYSGFQVSRDPANPFIWVASVLFIIGLVAVFYFPHREVWILAQKQDKGSRLVFRTSGRFGFGKSTEMANLIKEIESKVNITKGK